MDVFTYYIIVPYQIIRKCNNNKMNLGQYWYNSSINHKCFYVLIIECSTIYNNDICLKNLQHFKLIYIYVCFSGGGAEKRKRRRWSPCTFRDRLAITVLTLFNIKVYLSEIISECTRQVNDTWNCIKILTLSLIFRNIFSFIYRIFLHSYNTPLLQVVNFDYNFLFILFGYINNILVYNTRNTGVKKLQIYNYKIVKLLSRKK